MSNSHEHVRAQDILLYRLDALAPERRDDIEAEIAVCPTCHELFAKVRQLDSVLACGLPEAPPTGECPEEWEVGLFVGGDLPPDESRQISCHLQECDKCMDEAAAFFMSLGTPAIFWDVPKNWERYATEILSKEGCRSDRKEAVPSRFRSLIDSIRIFLAPLPVLPAYAVAAVAVILLVYGHLSRQDMLTIIPTTEKIAYGASEALPTMGFMGGDAQTGVNQMNIRVKGGQYIFRWKPIGGKNRYIFSLIERPGGGTIFSSGQKDEPEVRVPETLVLPGKLYSWNIEGKTLGGTDFRYTGDLMRTQ